MIKILCIICALCIILLVLNNKREKFMGYGNVFGVHINPTPNCSLSNDCHPGYYLRSQQYTNMCEPLETRLTREKVNIVDNCVKNLEGSMMINYCNNLPI